MAIYAEKACTLANKANRKDGLRPSAFGVDELYKLAKVNENGTFKQRFFEIVVFKYS